MGSISMLGTITVKTQTQIRCSIYYQNKIFRMVKLRFLTFREKKSDYVCLVLTWKSRYNSLQKKKINNKRKHRSLPNNRSRHIWYRGNKTWFHQWWLLKQSNHISNLINNRNNHALYLFGNESILIYHTNEVNIILSNRYII